MKKMAIKIPHFFKRHKIISITVLITVTMLSWWGVVNYMPHPLGKDLVYLGKKDYGRHIISDSSIYSVFYYGTDLDATEMKNIFTAQYDPLENLGFKNAYFVYKNDKFTFTYEDSSPFRTSKKYIVAIDDSDYSLAKKYLKK